MLYHHVPSSLQWHHNGHYSVSNHQPHDCLLNHLFRRRSKKTSKLRVTGLCVVNSPGTGEFPAQMASYTKNVSIWWRHHHIWTQRVINHWPIPHKGILGCCHWQNFSHWSCGAMIYDIFYDMMMTSHAPSASLRRRNVTPIWMYWNNIFFHKFIKLQAIWILPVWTAILSPQWDLLYW